jgi:hypothetical protein
MGQGSYCCICAAAGADCVFIPTVGQVCEQCLLKGRFLAGENLPGRWRLAENLAELAPSLGRQVEQLTAAAQPFVDRRDYQGARQIFLHGARAFRQTARPLLAYIILKKALGLPGLSAEVHEELAGALLDMECPAEAIQYLKTTSWLALKAEQDDILERSLKILDQLCPQDEWPARARGRRQARGKEPRLRCRLCGRDQGQAGRLIQEENSAICADCLQRVKKFSD